MLVLWICMQNLNLKLWTVPWQSEMAQSSTDIWRWWFKFMYKRKFGPVDCGKHIFLKAQKRQWAVQTTLQIRNLLTNRRCLWMHCPKFWIYWATCENVARWHVMPCSFVSCSEASCVLPLNGVASELNSNKAQYNCILSLQYWDC